MGWISINTNRPELGGQYLCYIVLTRHDNTVLEMQRILYYLKDPKDNRRRVFSDDYSSFSEPDLNIGDWGWPVTHWMPLPKAPGVGGS